MQAPSPKSHLACSSLKVLYSQNNARMKTSKFNRHIADAPTRILDAPDLVDDYYLNLLSWSQNNVLAVALGQAVYLWNAETGAIDELMQCSDPDDYVTSLSWSVNFGFGYVLMMLSGLQMEVSTWLLEPIMRTCNFGTPPR